MSFPKGACFLNPNAIIMGPPPLSKENINPWGKGFNRRCEQAVEQNCTKPFTKKGVAAFTQSRKIKSDFNTTRVIEKGSTSDKFDVIEFDR